jgi:SAM-dependent methyltransferase
MRDKKLNKEFSPSLFNPYYFVRRGIYNGVKKHAHHLKGKVVDFGCGSKPYRSFVNCDEYIGVDFENSGHPHENEQIDVFYDGKHLPFENNSVDAVLSSEVFEHIFNLPDILKELNRIMKEEATILITCPFVWKEHEEPYDFARYTLFSLHDMMVKNGFEKILQEKSGNFAEVIMQLRILLFYDLFYGKANRFLITRVLYKAFFIFLPNVIGLISGKIFQHQKKMYLNNIILYKKCKSVHPSGS